MNTSWMRVSSSGATSRSTEGCFSRARCCVHVRRGWGGPVGEREMTTSRAVERVWGFLIQLYQTKLSASTHEINHITDGPHRRHKAHLHVLAALLQKALQALGGGARQHAAATTAVYAAVLILQGRPPSQLIRDRKPDPTGHALLKESSTGTQLRDVKAENAPDFSPLNNYSVPPTLPAHPPTPSSL